MASLGGAFISGNDHSAMRDSSAWIMGGSTVVLVLADHSLYQTFKQYSNRGLHTQEG